MTDLDTVYRQLRTLMLARAPGLEIKIDSASQLYLDTSHLKDDKPLFFGAVKIDKKKVSYHLMPVYLEPSLLDAVSAGLRQRMQGKSCFNFSQADEALFAELAVLTEAAFASYCRQGFV